MTAHVVVTGGGTGTGAAIAKGFAAAGHPVTIMGRRETPLREQGLPFALCDVTDAAAVRAAFAAARAARGPVGIVVANAGAAESKPFAKMTADDLTGALAVNLTGVFNVWQAGLADMQTLGWGRMIAVASIAGLKGFGYVSAYSAAKHGVIGLTRSLALELATKGITVNALCPGYIETPMLERSVAMIMEKTGMTEDEARKTLVAGNPQRRFIQVDEIAAAALYLASDAAKSVNGHAMAISGGEI